jgi:hypothetical protein
VSSDSHLCQIAALAISNFVSYAARAAGVYFASAPQANFKSQGDRMISKPASSSVLEEALASHAQNLVKNLTDQEVLESLKQQGITSLEDLVRKSLAGLKAAGVGHGVVARDTFIYTQAVYKTAMPIDQSLINELSKKIGR